MPKHTLFVCKSCRRSEESSSENQPSDGEILLDTLQTVASERFTPEDLEIKPVHCLWACDRGCVVALSSPEKRTYLLVDLPPDKEHSAALLEVTQLYMSHRSGGFAWKKVPKTLESAFLACIPAPLGFDSEEDEEDESIDNT